MRSLSQKSRRELNQNKRISSRNCHGKIDAEPLLGQI